MASLLFSPQFWGAVVGLLTILYGVWKKWFSEKARRKREERKRLEEAAKAAEDAAIRAAEKQKTINQSIDSQQRNAPWGDE